MKYLVVMLLGLFSITAVAGSPGIESRNYNVRTSGSSSDSGSRTFLSAEARLPVTDYIGLFLNAGAEKFSGKNNFLDSSSKFGGLGVILREFDFGHLQARYSYNRQEFEGDLVLSQGRKSSIKALSLTGIYYINNFDVLLSRSVANIDFVGSIQTYRIGAAYYLNDNLRANSFVSRADSDNSYSISVLYQPEIFNNTIGISISYQDTKNSDIWSSSFTYYFDTKVSLRDRARRY